MQQTSNDVNMALTDSCVAAVNATAAASVRTMFPNGPDVWIWLRRYLGVNMELSPSNDSVCCLQQKHQQNKNMPYGERKQEQESTGDAVTTR